MFGLENQKKKKKPEEFLFELESQLMTLKGNKELKERIEKRVQNIKDTLRSGDSKQEFDQFGALLHGYTALLKVILRIAPKS